MTPVPLSLTEAVERARDTFRRALDEVRRDPNRETLRAVLDCGDVLVVILGELLRTLRGQV